MHKLFFILIALILTACAQEGPPIYGKIGVNSYVIAQICIKDSKQQMNNKLRYSILFKKTNFIRYLDPEPVHKNGFLFYDIPIGEKRNLNAFILPYTMDEYQYFGYVWDLKKTKVSSQWTFWHEPEFTVQDISDTNFKLDDGLIGRKIKDDSTHSPYLVRFRIMDFEHYIRNRVSKWENDPIPDCVVNEIKK